MIIVSQDKETIINFDKVTEIAQEDGEIGVSNDLYSDNFQVIGIYETEERAKEILQEIAQRYTNWENLKVGQPSGICSPRYVMPED